MVLSGLDAEAAGDIEPAFAGAGFPVISNSSAFRMSPDVPLVVPEVNADELRNIKKGIVANPNCVAIPLCVALKPLHDLATVSYTHLTLPTTSRV